MIGWWRTSSTRSPIATANPTPTTATATTPRSDRRASAPDSRRPLPHQPATAVATTATATASAEPPTCQRIPAAVTAQPVSAAGTSRRSNRAVAGIDVITLDEVAQLLQPRRPDAVHVTELVDAGESPIGVAPGDDRRRGDRTDAGQRVQLLRPSRRSGRPNRLAARRLSGCRRAVRRRGAGGPETIELPIAAGWPGAAAIPTMICSPSATRRAMFSPIRSAPSSAPPAAVSASAIRAPGSNVTSPGLCTRPDHADHHGSVGAGGAAPGVGLADETISTGGSLADATAGGLSRSRVNTVTSTAMTPTTASAMTPARPGSARTAATQPAMPSDLAVSGSHRDSEVSGLAVAVGIGLAVRAEAALQPLGGQFGSHAVTVGRGRTTRPRAALRQRALWMKSRMWIAAVSTVTSIWIVVSR